MTVFIHGDINNRVQDGFITLLPAADKVHMLGDKTKLSRIVAVPQVYRQTPLIVNLLEKTDEGTPSVTETTEREIALELLQFGRYFLCIF